MFHFLTRISAKITLILIIFTLLFSHTIAFAQSENTVPEPETRKIKIATKSAPPLVIINGNELTGYSIDLWREISKRLKVEGEFVVKDDVKSLLDSVINKEDEMGLAAISQTPERERTVDFSQSYLNAGLQVMQRANETSITDQVVAFLQSGAMKFLYFGVFVILILAILHLIYRKIRGEYVSYNILNAIWDSVWWLFNGFFRMEFGEQKDRIHQMITAFMIVISIIFVTQFQALVTADLTLDKLDSQIKSVDDIKGKKVGVVKGTTGQKFATENQLKAQEFTSNENLIEGLVKSDVDVVILDAPIAKFYVTNEYKDKAKESILLNKEHYAIAFPLGSPLRKEINQIILEMEQDGTTATLNKKWFGQE